MKNISIFLFVFALCMIGNVHGGKLFQGAKTTLVFMNGLGYKKWLKVHCQSGNNDMGVHYLKPGGIYLFSFHDNLMGNTLFWCVLSKGHDYKISSTFDAYVQDISKPHAGTYNYIASDDGIYHNNRVNFILHKKFDWNRRY
ncbi:hypothetical protein N665_0076s0085 [Sinapis alba]|nr:hypothetical protein N665_0076s0085 [Sinapis alba]